jgi:Txe/YoeB family toxin of Txe-Axe toxin-antitoxin module
MLTDFSPNIPKYFCETCGTKTNNKKDYDKHITTLKHKKLTSVNKELTENIPNLFFACQICKKEYKSRVGLWKHKKICNSVYCIETEITEEPSDKEPSDKEVIMMLIKENSEFKNMMIKVLENGTHNTTNSHNKTFNLNMFLNETCKNAMNINEFVDSLQLQMSDLENVGEAGYIEGISSIIIKKLNTLDITERPIHCTDKKRETMYIKDQDKWEKEDEKKTKMHKLVTKVANKNINMISEFQKLHPEWKKCSSKYADQHNKIVIESMGGKGDNEYEKQEKIIKKIAKEVFVEKCL